ncbi:MAG: hypothetical protein JEZ09_06525 [Salinivirgaceae bacterium]|nr:hypothetical protein [Salinivirgaceae bacterium]
MLKRIIIFSIILLFNISFINAQKDQGYLEIKGSVKVEREALLDAKVTVYNNGQKEKVYPVDDKGKFVLKINLNSQYEIVIGKQGYFSKKLAFNTNIPPEDVGIWEYKFNVGLFPEITGFDASLLDEPIGKIMFVSNIGAFDYDEEYTNNMLRRLKSLMREYEKAKREAFGKIVAQADAAFDKMQYDDAIELYDKAIDLDPYDPYPDDQIYMIGKIISQDENAEKNYQKNIEIADNNYKQLSYIDAKKYYNRALKYVSKKYPSEQIAAIDRLLEDQDSMDADLAAKNKAYMDAIAAADRSYTAKQYEPSLNKYIEASQIKTNEQYPKDRIAELNKIISELNANDAEKAQLEKAYREAIAKADASFGTKKYTEARASYVEASDLKPAEQYPNRKILEIDNLLAAGKSVEEKYKGFIKVADNAFAVKEYEISKKNYQQALSIKSNEVYPKNKINEIDRILLLMAQQKREEIDAAYNRAIAQGDAEFNKKAFENSKTFFNQALAIKINEVYPKQKIAEIDKLLGDIATKRRAYDVAIARADNNFNIEKWQEAKVDYQEALAIYPEEQYPRSRINDIENKLLTMNNAKDQLAAREKAYQEAIAQGDGLFNLKKYQESKNSYTKAISVKPTEVYPKQKIAEIDRLIASANAISQRYNQMISTADQHMINEQYQNAKDTYVNALQLKPNETYPKQKISEIDVILAKQLVDKARFDEIQKQYDQFITLANERYTKQEWQPAKGLYQQASALKPNEVLPKQRIVEIDNLLAGITDKNRKYQAAISQADQLLTNKSLGEALTQYNLAVSIKPNELYPKTKIAEINQLLEKQRQNEAAYDNYIKLADAAFQNKQLQQAKGQYQAALGVKPMEAYPKQKISEIDALINQQLSDKASREQIQKQYDALILQADAKYNSKELESAKSFYQQAANVKADEMYPKQRISEIDNLLTQLAETNNKYQQAVSLGDNLFSQKNYQQALSQFNIASNLKPNENYPKQKITELNGILQKLVKNEAAYDNYIKLADAAFQNKQLQQAKGQYQAAIGVKPMEAYPKQKISEIDALINQQLSDKASREQIQKQYDALILQADAKYNSKELESAKSFYQQAANVKADEMYPKQRISEIDNLLTQLAETNNKYQQAVSLGDNLFSQKNYQQALSQFNIASNLKPNENYPKQKITELNGILQKLVKNEAAYDNFINLADASYQNKDLNTAKGQYQSASSVKPNEAYPKQRIAEIDKLLAEQAKLLEDQQRIENQYNSFISLADNQFNAKNYEQAKLNYSKALQVKPNEVYPKQKISEIENIVNTLAEKDNLYNLKLTQGASFVSARNYGSALKSYQEAANIKPNEILPKQKMAEIQKLIQEEEQKSKHFDLLVAQADNLFNQAKYSQAKPVYQQAQVLLPEKDHPKNQIIKIDQLLAEQAKRDGELNAQFQAYNNKIAQADKAFGGKQFESAISLYLDAKNIKPDESYPDQQIARINKITQDNAAKLDADFSAAILKGDGFKNQKDYQNAKQQYNLASGLKQNDPLPKSKLVELQNLIDQENRDNAKQAKIDAEYNQSLSNADIAFKTKDYSSAMALYKSALSIKPNEKYPNDQVDICERKIQEQNALIQAEAERKRKEELEASQKSFNKKDFDYKGEKRDREFLNELAKQYPEGVTVENYEKPNKKIKRVIVNRGGIAKEYVQVIYSYGTYYFRNGGNISRSVFLSETKE